MLTTTLSLNQKVQNHCSMSHKDRTLRLFQRGHDEDRHAGISGRVSETGFWHHGWLERRLWSNMDRTYRATSKMTGKGGISA